VDKVRGDLAREVRLRDRCHVFLPSRVQLTPDGARIDHHQQEIEIGVGELLAPRHRAEQREPGEIRSERPATGLRETIEGRGAHLAAGRGGGLFCPRSDGVLEDVAAERVQRLTAVRRHLAKAPVQIRGKAQHEGSGRRFHRSDMNRQSVPSACRAEFTTGEGREIREAAAAQVS